MLCFWHLERTVESFLGAVPATLPAEPAAAFLEKKRVTYQGEIVSRCEVLTWAQVLPSLPPADKCASLDVLDLCDARMRAWFSRPLDTLVDLSSVKVRPRPGRVLVEPDSLLPLAQGLLERGLVAPLRESELLQVAGAPLLNGLFGVGKGTKVDGDPAGREVLRLIMNLTASNSVSIDYACDIGALPFFSQWRSIIIGPSEEVVWSFDDLK